MGVRSDECGERWIGRNSRKSGPISLVHHHYHKTNQELVSSVVGFSFSLYILSCIKKKVPTPPPLNNKGALFNHTSCIREDLLKVMFTEPQ